MMSLVGEPGFQASYAVTGDGPPLLLTHSFLADRSMWRHQREPLLAQGWQLIEVDLPGHGQSPPVERPFALEDLAELALALLDQEGIDRAVWCGLSIGGMLSMRAALRAPERVRALVLADTSASPETLSAKIQYRAMAAWNLWFGMGPLVDRVTPLYFLPASHRDRRDLIDDFVEHVGRMDRPTIKRYVQALTTRTDLAGAVSAIAVPTLVLVGAEDAALPEPRSRALAGAIAGSRYEVIPDAGHLSPLERPELVNPALLEFLEPHLRS